MLVFPDGRIVGTIGGGCVEADVIRSARDVMDTGTPRRLTFHLHGEEAERTGIACGGIVEIMVESLEEARVVLIGAGHVAQAVARLASRLDFRVTVADDRPDFANRERFPDADEIVVADLDKLAGSLKVARNSAVICMTRGHAEDLTALRFALTTPARYVGVLGSKGKRVQFREALAADGVAPDVIGSIRMPVGLDIGAETVEEIAVAIVAELIRERRSR
jgi:xanthine dehydrogenase accessory factor